MSEPHQDTVRIPPAPAPDHFVPGPKKDTARIAILPRATPAPVVAAARPVAALDSIPKPYYWAIFGLAALIFIIQIWNFFVS
ncbi:MAG: hypothetical protein WAO00_13060 [Chthoniobacterales bacterium]